ncbi:hypothetical protein F5888DRAFT_432838 [Russula emetica]|nr:hypothetical protein F5888DRAFT_432838 [Russula emetica]
MSLSHSLEWHMLIRPFREIANRLAHFWSYLSINLSVNLPSPPRLSLWDFLPGRGRGCYRHYRSLAEEQKWWDESARIRGAFFAPLDARYDGRGRAKKISAPDYRSPIPLIMSYVPRLLPQYRDHCRLDDAATECELTPSVYRKWHRLVFPNETLPSRSEAARVIRYLSTRDRREIARIARLVPDEAVAQKGFSPSSTYRDLWTSWLEHKGPDLTIVFE